MKKLIPLLASALAFVPQYAISQDAVLVDTGEVYGHGPYYGVESYGNASYVNDASQEIKVFDISDASNISLSGELQVGCTVDDLDIVGATLVAKCPFEIHFYDLTNNLNPQLIGSYESTGYAINSVELSGDRLYIGGGNSDVAIFDASDLSNIQEISTKTFGSISSWELKKSGNYIYTITDFNTVKVFDVSNESNIVKTTEILAVATQFRDVLVIDNTLYIAASDGLKVYDVTDMSSPVFVKTINSGSMFDTIDLLTSLHSIGNALYAGKNNGRIFQFDITTRQDPVYLTQNRFSTGNTYKITDNGTSLSFAYGVDGLVTAQIETSTKLDHYARSILPKNLSMSNGTVLVSDETGMYHIIDITLDNTFRPQGREPYTGNTLDGEIDGNIAWLGTGSYLETRDLSAADSWTLLDIQQPDPFSMITFLSKVDNVLYLGTNRGMVAMYDVSSNIPSLIASVNFPINPETGGNHYITDIVHNGNYILASSTQSELLAADFSNMESPTVIDIPKMSEITSANLYVSGNKLLSASHWGAYLIDISDIENPFYSNNQLSELGLITAGIKLNASQVLLSSTEGLLTVDIADPDNISIVTKVSNAPEFSSLATDGNYVVASVRFASELKLYKFNKAPTAPDYQFDVDEDNSLVDTIDSTDPDGDEITFSIVGQTSNGTVNITTSGQFTYQPNSNFNGQDSFIYKTEDTYGNSSEGIVTITVNAVNDAPNAISVSLTTAIDSAVSGSFNASDADGDELTYENTNPSNGTLSVSGTRFTYTPASGFTGQDSFQYTVTDPSGISSTATVTITVNQASSSGGGGSSDLWLLALLALGFAFRRQVR